MSSIVRRTTTGAALLGGTLLAAALLAAPSAARAPSSGSEHAAAEHAAVEDAAPVQRSAPVMIVLDASGSMTTADAPGPRIAAAKRAVTGLLGQLPDDAQVGLEAYGTRTSSAASAKAAGCRDIRVLTPVGPVDRAAMSAQVNSIKASGYTPIGAALRKAAAALPAAGPRSIVLVSDGEDTCAPPDPCTVARELKAAGVDLTVHTVGFKVDAKARAQLRCVARATGGSYRDAADGPALSGQLSLQVQHALRGYTTAGTPVSGGENAGAAPTLEPGQYTDSLAHGEQHDDLYTGSAKFYRVNLEAGATPYLSATIVAPDRRADELSTLQVLMTVQPLDDDTCQENANGYNMVISNKTSAPTAVVAPGSVGTDDTCLPPGPAVVKVQRAGKAYDDEPLQIELAYRSEPPADTSGQPGPSPQLHNVRTGLGGTPRAVDSGSSFNDAPEVPSGVYRDAFSPGETRYLKVHLDWGQRLVWSYSAARVDGYSTDDDVTAYLTVANPARAEVTQAIGGSGTDIFVGAVDGSMYGSTAAPVRYANRTSTDSGFVSPLSIDGDYYLVLSTGFAKSGNTARIPYTIKVDVQGRVQPGPRYETPAPTRSGDAGGTATGASSRPAPGSGRPSGTSGPARASSSPVAAASREGTSATPTIIGAVCGAVILLAGLGGGFVWYRRRDGGHAGDQHTRVLPADR